MADKFTKEQRSYIMSRIKGKNTGIELAMEKILKKGRIRYKKHPKMHGNPDFILSGSKTVVFCDGEFWHGKGYRKRKAKLSQYWRDKIETNMRRDKRITRELTKAGWVVVRMWGNDILKNQENIPKALFLQD